MWTLSLSFLVWQEREHITEAESLEIRQRIITLDPVQDVLRHGFIE
jgi:hypothetical protein